MDIITAAAVLVVAAALVAVAVRLVREVLLDGSGARRAPEHGHAHWSGASGSSGSASLPDAPYRDRIA